MKYEIVRSREGFEVLKPVMTPAPDFASTIVMNDSESWDVPYLNVGINLFNPGGYAAVWIYNSAFYAVPDGLRKNGFKSAGIGGDTTGFEASPAEIIKLWKVRYGDHFTSTESAIVRQFAEQMDSLYAEHSTDTYSECELFQACRNKSVEFLSYVMRDQMCRILTGISSLDSHKMSPTYKQLLDTVKNGAPEATSNVRITESDASHLGVAVGAQLARLEPALALAKGSLIKNCLVCFSITDDKLAVAKAFNESFNEALSLLA